MALVRLVVFSKQYWRGDYDSDQVNIPASLKTPKKHASDAIKEAWNEHEEAIRIAYAILEYNGIRDIKPLRILKDIDGSPVGWKVDESAERASEETRSEVGSEYIYIPRFPRV